MKTLLLILSLVCALAASAEQRVIVIDRVPSSTDSPVQTLNLTPLNNLLSKGWRVSQVSVGGTGAQHGSLRMLTYVFVLESPDTLVAPQLSVQVPVSQGPDLKTIWETAYRQQNARGSSLSRTYVDPKEFADQVIAAVVAANPGKTP
jgi:hypothetical protein